MELEQKIKELATKYDIPESLFKEAIQIEREKVVSQKRKLTSKLVEMIERYTAS